jgi:hypothetical protein
MRTFIGVDPALRLNGMAVCIIVNQTMIFKRYKRFVDFIKDVENWMIWDDPIILVEDSSLQNLTFNNSINRSILSRMSRNVGMNQAASRIAYEYIKDNGFEAYNISPEAKGKKFNKEVFMKVVASERLKFEPDFKPAKISQDEIDAFFLALMAKNYMKHGK